MSLTPDEEDEYEERAAIMEHDGGMTKDKAEAAAMDRILAKRGDVQRGLW